MQYNKKLGMILLLSIFMFSLISAVDFKIVESNIRENIHVSGNETITHREGYRAEDSEGWVFALPYDKGNQTYLCAVDVRANSLEDLNPIPLAISNQLWQGGKGADFNNLDEIDKNDPTLVQQGNLEPVFIPDSDSGNGMDRYGYCYTPTNETKIKMFNNSIYFELINETWYEKESEAFEQDGYLIQVLDDKRKVMEGEVSWVRIGDSKRFFWNAPSEAYPIKKFGYRIWNNERGMTFNKEMGRLEQTPIYILADVINEKYEREDTYLNFDTFIYKDENIITSAEVHPVKNAQTFDGISECSQGKLSDFFSCLNTIRYHDIMFSGTIWNTDPETEITITEVSPGIGWNNRTEFTALGARLDAPVLFMDFNKENESLYVQDNSIYNNYGTLGNGTVGSGFEPTYNASCGVTGSGFDLGGCYEFDGVDDIITGSDVSAYDTNEGAFSMWLKTTDSGSSIYVGSFADTGATNTFISLGRLGAGEVTFYYKSHGGTVVRFFGTGTTVNDGEWHHIITQSNGSAYECYVDGVKQTLSFSTGVNDGLWFNDLDVAVDDFTIGALTRTTTVSHFEGSIDQVQIFDRALSANEVLNLYNGTKNNTDYIGKYASDGDFKSLVFYNDTSTYWNTTFSIADSTGGYEVNLTDPNLVSYWELNENFLDTVGDNDGTPNGDIVNATGLSSGAMMFDGDGNDHVDFLNDELFFTNGSTGTFSFWMQPNSLGTSTGWNTFDSIMGKRSGTIPRFVIGYDSNGHMRTWMQTGAEYYVSEGDLSIEEWHHIVLVFDENNKSFYFDGVYDGSSNTGVLHLGDSYPVMLGTDGYANTFNGSLDEVLYYNRSLSPSEVSDLYKAGLSQHANANVTLETRVATSYNVSDASLVGLWGLNGNANDELGVNNGTWQGDETYGEGNGTVGQGGYFDGTGDYVNFTDSNSLSPGNITISSWVKFSNSGGTPIFIMKDHEYLIQAVESGTDVIRVGVSFSGTTFNLVDSVTTSSSLEDEWHYYAMSFDGSTLKLYIDGTLDNSDSYSGSIQNTANNLAFGIKIAEEGGTAAPLDGAIDEVRIYNRSLSADEIQNLYELGSYHIEWGEWEQRNKSEDLIPQTSNSSGNFFQYRESFLTDNTDVSPYILNYTVGPGTAPTPPNTVPDNPTPILESLNPTNWTESDLNCSATITDPDADDMNATIRWYKGGVLNKTENFLNQPNGTQIESSISSDLLQIEQMWECSMNLTDGLLNSNVINSSNLTILPTQTALEMINITIPDFTFSSSTYQLFYEFQFNTSDSEDFLTAVDSFNLAKLTGSGSNDIYMKFVLDDVSLFDYKVRSVSKITGQLDEGISMNLPLVSNTTNGEHTLKLYIRKTGTGDVSINDIDFTLIKLRSGLGNKVETLLLEDTYNFNSATFEEQETFLFNFTPTPAHELYFLSSVTVNSTGDTEIVCYTRDNALGVDTPYAVRSSSAGTTGTIQLSAINPVRQINFNTSLYCLSTTGEDVTAIVTALNFPMRDIKGNPFNFNFGINSATNWTNNRTLTSGSNSIVNTTLTVQNGTNALVTMSTSSYMAVHEDPVFYLATNGTAICDTKKERHFGGETTGSSFINVLCTNLSVGETYLFDFRVNNTNDMTIYDEAINVFEGTEFDIAISNTPPIASILTPIDDETIQGEYNITFDITDTQLDPYEVNITLTNSTGTYFVVENFPDGGNYLFNTTDFKDGEYNMTLIACENETTDAFCGNDTVSIMISQQPVVTILYPTNGIINHQITEINISVDWADGQGSCWYSLDDGATNSSTISGDLNFTGISEGVEGTNDLIVYCNNSNGNIGSDVTSFTIDFPPALEINSPTDGSQVDLTFNYTQTCLDTQGVDSQWYHWNGVNYTYTGTTPINLFAGSWSITAYCNDTLGQVVSDTNSFSTLGIGGVTPSTVTCRYKKLGYYNLNRPWMKESGCIE